MMLKRDRFVIIALRQAAEAASQEWPAELGELIKYLRDCDFFCVYCATNGNSSQPVYPSTVMLLYLLYPRFFLSLNPLH